MSERKITTNRDMNPCPKCGNTRVFKIVSQQVCEDGCEVWAECKCGHAPDAGKFEDVMGGTGPENANCAMAIWNEIHEPTESEADPK